MSTADADRAGTPGDHEGLGESVEVVVGRIGKPHGLRGEVTIDVRSDEPDLRFAAGSRLRSEQGNDGSTLTVATTRWHQGVLLVRFDEAGDRTSAEALRGTVLHARLAVDATPEDPEEFYAHQLIGLAALDLEGRHLGEVVALTPGAQDLLTIRTPEGRDALVPFVAALVPEVDVVAGRIVVADRPGLVTPFEDES